MFDFVGVGILIVLVVLFAWFVKRSWGSRRKILKWVTLVPSVLLTLIFALLLVVALIGFSKLNATYNNPVPNVNVQRTPEQMARGAKFAEFCAGCHSSTQKPPLGGQNFLTGEGAGAPPVGTLYAPNLTPGGHLNDWSDGEVIRAIREGVHKNGRSLLIMPSDVFHSLSDADVQSIAAYLRSQPPVTPDSPPTNFNTLGAILVGAGIFNVFTVQPPITQPVAQPPAGTPQQGKYLVDILGCRVCHGENLAGGTPSSFGPPAGPNLTTLVPKWSEADFIKTIRTGVDPAGKSLDPRQMPWREISTFASDDELKAMYAYLKGLTPIQK